MKFDEIKDNDLDLLEALPNIIWYAGCFILGLVVGSW